MPTVPIPKRAAQYARMSTERQEYSLAYQMEANAAYALEHGLEICRSYKDAGISGLSIQKRAGLKSLLADVVSGEADFTVIIVYDVSRWGRFQNPDQAAHYEFICAEAGVRVAYAAESFDNDGSMTSTLLKTLKRAMAAEYSRDLSLRTGRAKRGLARLGYWIGRPAAYGLRRCFIPKNGGKPTVFEFGEHKPIGNGRSVLVRGPEHEVRTIRQIFRSYNVEAKSCSEIAADLNRRGVRGVGDAAWSLRSIRGVLENEAYAGTYVFHKSRTNLGERTLLPPSDWARLKLTFPPIVPRATFNAAAAEMRRRHTRPNKDQLIEELRRVYQAEGKISESVIRRASVYGPHSYAMHFGTLPAAYTAAGIPLTPSHLSGGSLKAKRKKSGTSALSDEEVLDRVRALLAEHGRLTNLIFDRHPGGPTRTTLICRFGSIGNVYGLVGYEPTERQSRMLGRTVCTNHKRKPRPTTGRVLLATYLGAT